MDTYQIVVAVITLIVVPAVVSIAANLCTPKIQDWWSARSRRSLERRIAYLQEEIQRSHELTEIVSFGFTKLFLGLTMLCFVTIPLLAIMLVTFLEALRHIPPSFVPKPEFQDKMNAVIILLAMPCYPFYDAYMAFRRVRVGKARTAWLAKTQERLNELQLKLGK